MPYLVFPMLPKDRATIFFGEGGSGKSYFGALLTLTIASGREVFPGWRPQRPGKVLVLDWEADREEWNERLLLIAAGAGIDPEEFAGRVRYRSCITSLVDQVEELSKIVKDEGIDLVVVDSVGMASPGAREGTDANEGALALFRGLRLLRCTCLLVDHVNKASKENASGARDPYGSIFKTNLARQTWEVRREDPEGESNTASLLLINRKVNNGPRRDPVSVVITYDDDSVTFERGELDEVSDALAVSVPSKIKIEALLKREGWQTKAEIADAMPEVKDPTLRAALAAGIRKGWLVKDPNRERYGLVARTKVDDSDF